MGPPLVAEAAARARTLARMPFGPVDPDLDLPALEERALERWRAADVVAAARHAAEGQRALDLLRGAAHRERPAGHPPRVGPGLQGPLPPLPDDAGPRRRPQGRLGLPRAPGGGRGREGARASTQARDRGLRHRRVQPRAAASRCTATSRTGRPSPSGPACGSTPPTPTGPSTTPTSSRCGGSSASSGTAACSTRATRSSPYCGRCGTALSSHELGQPDAYRDVTDPSVYVRFPVVDRDVDLLVWTTTPWTLVSNVAAAVGPDIDYVRVRGRRRRGATS